MKKRVIKIAAVALMFIGTFAITVPTAFGAMAVGNKDCDTYCESSTEFHCELTYSDGSQVLCLNMQVKGTSPTPTQV